MFPIFFIVQSIRISDITNWHYRSITSWVQTVQNIWTKCLFFYFKLFERIKHAIYSNFCLNHNQNVIYHTVLSIYMNTYSVASCLANDCNVSCFSNLNLIFFLMFPSRDIIDYHYRIARLENSATFYMNVLASSTSLTILILLKSYVWN